MTPGFPVLQSGSDNRKSQLILKRADWNDPDVCCEIRVLCLPVHPPARQRLKRAGNPAAIRLLRGSATSFEGTQTAEKAHDKYFWLIIHSIAALTLAEIGRKF